MINRSSIQDKENQIYKEMRVDIKSDNPQVSKTFLKIQFFVFLGLYLFFLFLISQNQSVDSFISFCLYQNLSSTRISIEIFQFIIN